MRANAPSTALNTTIEPSVVMVHQQVLATGPSEPRRAVQFWSFALPVLKCAVCPACLSLFGGVFAGARLGFVGSEGFHGSVLAVALVADFFILGAAMRHHQSRGPMILCLSGGVLALAGHLIAPSLEFVGFGLMMLAAAYNLFLLRRRRSQDSCCCTQEA